VRVLVIEDYELLRDSIAQGFRENGFSVDVASDGEDGLWQAQSGAYDVIVLDLMLPKVPGLTILQRLRDQKSNSHIIVLTARDTTEDKVLGLNLGADDYLVKPFRFDELLARVRALVRRKYATKSPILRVADLEIDTLARVARRCDRLISLSMREYALLEFLAMREGQVVSRADIWDHVYDFRSEADSNVVDVYIGHLRRKIERPDLPKLIHTRRGHGYMVGVVE